MLARGIDVYRFLQFAELDRGEGALLIRASMEASRVDVKIHALFVLVASMCCRDLWCGKPATPRSLRLFRHRGLAASADELALTASKDAAMVPSSNLRIVIQSCLSGTSGPSPTPRPAFCGEIV